MAALAEMALVGMAAPPVGSIKSHLRCRGETETEPGVFFKADKTLSAPVQVKLRSLKSSTSCTILFRNTAPVAAVAVWMDFEGNEIAYSVIEPGATKKYRTYATHPWIMRAADSGERLMLGSSMVVYADEVERTAVISMPPLITWSMANHKFWGIDFKLSVRVLLLMHSRASCHKEESTSMDCDQQSNSSDNQGQVEGPSDSSKTDGDMLCTFEANNRSVTDQIFCRLMQCTMTEWNDSTASPSREDALESLDPAFSPTERMLGNLPTELVIDIVRSMAPELRQFITALPDSCPDVQPVLLPSDPETWEPPMSAAILAQEA